MPGGVKDLSIDEARAKIWVDDVKNEIEAVQIILQQVNTAVKMEESEKDDTIIQGLNSVGKSMDESWTKMCKTFIEAQDKVVEAIEHIGKAVGALLEVVEGLKGLFKW